MMDYETIGTVMPLVVAALALGYLLGSIPFGLIVTHAAGLGDIRRIGSGNIGATNVLRTGNRRLAALTLLLDALKGAAAVLIAGFFEKHHIPALVSAFGEQDLAMAAGAGAFLGHIFPLWLGFRGGKGVATYLGVLAALSFMAALVFALVWLATAYLSRYSSLAAILAAIAVPIALYFLGHEKVAALFAVMSLIIIARHRANISRLISGNESKVGSKG